MANVGSGDYLASARQWKVYRYGMRKADEMGLALWLCDEKGWPDAAPRRVRPLCDVDSTARGFS